MYHRPKVHRTIIAAVAIVFATGTTACGKGTDCKAFRDAVGDTEHDLGSHGDDLAKPDVVASVQKEIAGLVDRVKAATIKDKDLSDERDDYVRHLQDMSKLLDRMKDPKVQADKKSLDDYIDSYHSLYTALGGTRGAIRQRCE